MSTLPPACTTPVNKTASRVVSVGTHYEPANAPRADEWDDNPPPTRPVPRNAPNLTGERKDRVVIVGYLGPGNGGGSKWLGRCSCGRYVTRNAKPWRKCTGSNMCSDCAHVEYLKRHATYAQKQAMAQRAGLTLDDTAPAPYR